MRLVTHQPYSIHAVSGGARILRRLFANCEHDVVSLWLKCSDHSPPPGRFREVEVEAFPVQRAWQRGPLRKWNSFARNRIFRKKTIACVRQAASCLQFDALHVVAHGRFNDAFSDPASRAGKPLWVSFHDHYIPGIDSPEGIGALWRAATRRFTISHELGEKYCRDFGELDWSILSDGVEEREFRPPSNHVGKNLTIYFGGMLHLDYYPLFETLADALDHLAESGWKSIIRLRGTQRLPFMEGRRFELERLPQTLSDDDLNGDLEQADILYLPIGFTMPHFYLHSLSTKMVGYLAAPGAILYHGPSDSAAAGLLRPEKAAGFCENLDSFSMAKAVIQVAENSFEISANAKILARSRFNLSEMRHRFWNPAL